MTPGKQPKVSITREQIREVCDQGSGDVENLVFPLVVTVNYWKDIVVEQNTRIEAQEERIKKLEDQINKNSRNSSKPPSSDFPYKNKSKKKSQFRKVQKRAGKMLKLVSNPDETVLHKVKICKHCHRDISDVQAIGIERREVTDIPPVQAYTTEHLGEIVECPHCHEITKAAFPF